jgi:signal transduction histidine kinase
MLMLFLYVSVFILNIALGSLILNRSYKASYSRYFFVVCSGLALWVMSIYLTESRSVSLGVNRVFNSLSYASALAAMVHVVLFSFSFPKRMLSARASNIIIITGLFSSAFAATGLVSGRVSSVDGGLEFSNGPMLPVYGVVLLALLIISVARMVRTYVVSAKDVREKNQIRLMLFGFVTTAALGLVTNVLLPLVTHNYASAKASPALALAFIGFFAYAILKYKLFDLRPVVARSIAYILSITTLVITYALVTLLVARFLFSSGIKSNISLRQELYFIFLAAGGAVLFQPIKIFFDDVSQKIFYRDAYSEKDIINELNRISSMEPTSKKLLERVAILLSDKIGVECAFLIIDQRDELKNDRVGARLPVSNSLLKILSSLDEDDTLIDYRFDPDDRVKHVMDAASVSVAMRIITGQEPNQNVYLLLGPKKSGNNYSRQDISFFESAKGTISIGIKNAYHFEVIQLFNITLTEKIDRATRELKRSNAKLKALDEAKDEFISMASHQLRTPLTSIKGYLSMVLEGDAGAVPEAQKSMLTTAYTSAQRMVYLIADLLNVSRLQTGKFVIEPTDVDLRTVIASELDQLRETIAAKGLMVEYASPADFPIVPLDETKIRQVVMNFIDNALYYTPSGGVVRVELADKPKSIEFLVVDNGIGVPKADQHKLFAKFYRAGNAQRARPDGTGLGLFMAQKVIVASGGAIIFKSSEGKGSTFGFTFPKKKDI